SSYILRFHPPPLPTSTLFPYTTLFRSSRKSAVPMPRRTAAWIRAVPRIIASGWHIRRLAPHRQCGIEQDQVLLGEGERLVPHFRDRKSTRLNSSHSQISYAVFCLKKKK